jgi:hypothetical protein
MEPLVLEETKKTPKIVFDKNNGIFQIAGRSVPEHAVEFYEPAINWLKQYFSDPNESTILQFDTEYFNTSTSKIFLDLVQILEAPVSKGIDVKVHWYYDDGDEDCLEAGQAYESIVKVPFVFVVRKEG